VVGTYPGLKRGMVNNQASGVRSASDFTPL
jgi:hypothetical protein